MIGVKGSVAATALGIMKGTLADTFARVSSTWPLGSRSFRVKLRASWAVRLSTSRNSSWPAPSRLLQRCNEATQSSAVTSVPSCHFRPSRRVKVQVFLSAETVHLSTICGWGSKFSSIANRVS
ncbi:hypothetical protein D9M70_625560 [compost metagenome]